MTSTQTSEVREMALLKTQLLLEQEADALDVANVVAKLAALYAVPDRAISIELRGGSAMLLVEISVDVALSQSLSSTVQSVSDTQLSVSLGSTASRASELSVVLANQTVMREHFEKTQGLCPVGHWCTAGLPVECEPGFFNPFTGTSNQTACTPCPARRKSKGPRPTLIATDA